MELNGVTETSYSAAQFAPLFAAEDRHFWFRSRNRCISAALQSLSNFGGIHDVLEVGCGTGVVLAELKRLFPHESLTGMDLFDEGLAFARKRFNGTLIKGDVLTYEFPRTFDLIGIFDVIEHLDDDVGILKRLWRQLKPGGYLILTVPAHQSLWSYFDEVAHHRRRYSEVELKHKLAAAGFDLVHATFFMSVLFFPMWLKRRLLGEHWTSLSRASAGTRQTAVESDLKINPVTNRLVEMMLRPESFLIKRGMRLPFGTSLLAVARRPGG